MLQAKQTSHEILGSKELSQQAESVTDKADLLLKQQVIEELKNQLHVSFLVRTRSGVGWKVVVLIHERP